MILKIARRHFRFFVILMKLVVIFLTIWGLSFYFVMISKRRILDFFNLMQEVLIFWTIWGLCSNLRWYQNVAIGHFTIFYNLLKEIIIFWAFWGLFVLICNDVKTAYSLITAYPWMILTAYPLSVPADKQKYLIRTSSY